MGKKSGRSGRRRREISKRQNLRLISLASIAMAEVVRTDYTPKSSFLDDLQVLKAMWFGNIKGGSHQDQLESFYNKQAHLYDQYRHRMLHGRKPLMMKMPVEKDCVWVDLGGGTASNVEFFSKSIKDWFKAVYVV